MVRQSSIKVELEDSNGTFIEVPYIEADWEQPGTDPSQIPTANVTLPYNSAVTDTSGSTILVKDLVSPLSDIKIHRNGSLSFHGEIVANNRKVGPDGISVELEARNKHYLNLRNTVCDAYPAHSNTGGKYSGIIQNPWSFSNKAIGIKYPGLGITDQVNYNLSLRPDEAVEHVIEKKLIQYLTPKDNWNFDENTNRPQMVYYLPEDSGDVDLQNVDNAQRAWRFSGDTPGVNILTVPLSHGSPFISPSFYGTCDINVSLYGFRTDNGRTAVQHITNGVLDVSFKDSSGTWVPIPRDTSMDDWSTASDKTGWKSGYSIDNADVNQQTVQLRVEFEESGNLPANFNQSTPVDFVDLFFVKVEVVNEDQYAIVTPGTIEEYDPNPENFLKNPGFEFQTNGQTPDNWTVIDTGGFDSTPTIESRSEQDSPMGGLPENYPGNSHLLISANNTNGGTDSAGVKQTVDIVGGEVYSFGCRVDYQTLNDDPPVQMKVEWLDSTGTVLQTDTASRSSQGQIVVNAVSAPSNAVQATVTVQATSDGSASQDAVSVLIDGVQLQKVDTLDSFIGTLFGKSTHFFYDFYGSNRLQALQEIREKAANDLDLDNPTYDVYIDSAGKLHFEKERGVSTGKTFSFAEHNLINLEMNESSDIYNTLEALGSGNGALQTRLQGSIVDTDSISKYGKREYQFRDSGTSDIVTLEAKAWAFLKAHSTPSLNINATLRSGFDINLNVGDRVIIEDDHFGVSNTLRVKSISHSFSNDGEELDIEFWEKFPSASENLMTALQGKTDGTKAKDTTSFNSSPTMGTELRFGMIPSDPVNAPNTYDKESPASYSFYIPSGKAVKSIKFFARTAPFDTFSRGMASDGGQTKTSEGGGSFTETDTSTDTPVSPTNQILDTTLTSWTDNSAVSDNHNVQSNPRTLDNVDFYHLELVISPGADVAGNVLDLELKLHDSSTNTRFVFEESAYVVIQGNDLRYQIIIPVEYLNNQGFNDLDQVEIDIETRDTSGQSVTTSDGNYRIFLYEATTHTHNVTISQSNHTHNVTIDPHTHDLDYGVFTLEDSNGDEVYPQNVKMFINRSDATVATDNPIDEVPILNPNGEDETVRPDGSGDSLTPHWKYHQDKFLGADVTDYFREVQGNSSTPVVSGEHTVFFGVTDTPDGTDNPKNLGKVYVQHVIEFETNSKEPA